MPELPRFSRSVEAGIGENFPNLQIPLRSCIPASRSPAFYNVLEKLRSGEPLTAKEKQIHDQGLVTVLRQIHDELDEAVLEAYGWEDCSGDHRSPSPPEASRPRRHGNFRSFKNPKSTNFNRQSTPLPPPWPDRLPDQVAILRKLIAAYDKNVATPDPESISAHFGRKNKKRTEQIEGILETLKGLGQL
jgi:hypothetical protein